MKAEFQTYLLALPSGARVVVRKADAAALLGRGRMLFPLLSQAVAFCDEGNTPIARSTPPPSPDAAMITTIRGCCEAVLVDPRVPEDMSTEEIPLLDAVAIYQWATAPGDGPAVPHELRDYAVSDFNGMVKSDGALLLDMLASRYGLRPSACLGLAGADFALDMDLAVAYRGRRRENAGDEVEVEDMWGNKHKVPRRMLATSEVPHDGKVVTADSYAQAYGPITLSAGGMYGDGKIGPMPR